MADLFHPLMIQPVQAGVLEVEGPPELSKLSEFEIASPLAPAEGADPKSADFEETFPPLCPH